MTTATLPVLIVGAGPTGLTAAMELSRFGIPLRLIDKAPGPATTSRAFGVQARTLELFEQRGLSVEMLKVGRKQMMGNFYGGGHCVFRLQFAKLNSTYNYILSLSQAETERILREQLLRQGITIEHNVELIALTQLESAGSGHSGVMATLNHKNGQLEKVEAAYLISAEGAHSTVRTSLGLKFHGKSLDSTYVLADLYIDGNLSENEVHIFSSNYGFLGLFPIGECCFRMVASNPLSKTDKNSLPQLNELQKIYDMRSHIPLKFQTLGWSSYFHINSRMIDKFMHGNIFFGGDAAHIHSPAGGQGMNTGIQDMINLGWKLAMVIQGKASPELLATYDEERIPIIRQIIRGTAALTRVIVSERWIVRNLFNYLTPLMMKSKFIQQKGSERISQIALNYRQTTLSENHPHQGALRAGDRIPDLSVTLMPRDATEKERQAVKLFSLLNPSKFTLLCVNIDDRISLHQDIETKLVKWQAMISVYQLMPYKESQAASDRFRDIFATAPTLFLVRPDSYVGFIGRTSLLPQLVAYLEKWFL
jgi:2-polyprenyl-6-methoxyphenol hydroxylase-like FAD-dependent oxidoreductase